MKEENKEKNCTANYLGDDPKKLDWITELTKRKIKGD